MKPIMQTFAILLPVGFFLLPDTVVNDALVKKRIINVSPFGILGIGGFSVKPEKGSYL